MRHVLLLLLAAGLPTHAAVAQVAPAPQVPLATRVQVRGADCALFPAAAKLYPPVEGMDEQMKRFTPLPSQADEAEAALPQLKLESVSFSSIPHKYAAEHELEISQNLALYRRQYYGFYDGEQHPCLFINFFKFRPGEDARFATRHPTLPPPWLADIVLVDDGGTDYWFVFYDLTTKRFYNFYHH